MVTQILPITANDRTAWEVLWGAYLEFYETELPPGVTDNVFDRLVNGGDILGAIAWSDKGEALGIAHWLFHPSTWSSDATCYLADLFVRPEARGQGVGRELIAHVSRAAENAGAHNLYWHTHESNSSARILYDGVARRTGHIEYEIARPGA